MNNGMALLGTFGTLSVIYLLYILLKLSQRLGSVQKMAPAYKYYYMAMIFVAVGYMTNLLIALAPHSLAGWLTSPWVLIFGYYLPMSIGLTVGLVITWRYWSWLLTNQYK